MDTDGTKFAGRTANEITNQTMQGTHLGNSEGKRSTPQCLHHVIGKTCKFEVKVTTYNFKAGRQTFTVSRVIDDNIIIAPNHGGQGSKTEEPNGAGGAVASESTALEGSKLRCEPDDYTQKKKQKLDESCSTTQEEGIETVE